MYVSPINLIIQDIKVKQEKEIFRAIQEYGVEVDKDELIKALEYDRDQYQKGYTDGIKEFSDQLKRKMLYWIYDFQYNSEVIAAEREVDNLVREMTGDGK